MKPTKTKRLIGTIILVPVSLFLLFSAFGKFTGHPVALMVFDALNIPHLRIPLPIFSSQLRRQMDMDHLLFDMQRSVMPILALLARL